MFVTFGIRTEFVRCRISKSLRQHFKREPGVLYMQIPSSATPAVNLDSAPRRAKVAILEIHQLSARKCCAECERSVIRGGAGGK